MNAPARTAEQAVLELARRQYNAHRRNPGGEERQLWALAELFGDEVVIECEARMWVETYRKRDSNDPEGEAAEWLRASASVWLQAVASSVRFGTPEEYEQAKERCRENARLFTAAARRIEEAVR